MRKNQKDLGKPVDKSNSEVIKPRCSKPLYYLFALVIIIAILLIPICYIFYYNPVVFLPYQLYFISKNVNSITFSNFGCYRNMKKVLNISDYPYLEKIVVKQNALSVENQLIISNNPSLKSIMIEEMTLQNVDVLELSSTKMNY